jgi:membrane-associated phospholipid phosphatase
LASVYLNHHYIVDGIAGMAIAGLVFAVTGYFSRWRRRARACGPASTS